MRIDGDLVVVVTGGSSGLGLSTIQRLSKRGARVVVADLNEEAGINIAKEMRGVFIRVDVTDQ